MLKKYSGFIRKLPHKVDTATPESELLLWRSASKKLECFYAPFDYINYDAKIIIVGLTPGKTQMNRALNAARISILRGDSVSETINMVKRESSFSGKMREKLVKTLNRTGHHKLLGINCSSDLWSTHNHLVQFCSLLKYPVLSNGQNYNGTPKLFSKNEKELKTLIYEEFVKDLHSINPRALLVPLGDDVGKAISILAKEGSIPQKFKEINGKVISLPHPSPANNESIDLLLKEGYLSKKEYENKMYEKYIREKLKNGENPQHESTYKKARSSRWESMLLVRKAYGIDKIKQNVDD